MLAGLGMDRGAGGSEMSTCATGLDVPAAEGTTCAAGLQMAPNAARSCSCCLGRCRQPLKKKKKKAS